MAPLDTAKAKKAKSSSSHPPYIEMVKDAIVSLKDRTGSSQYAIAKFMEEKQKSLPPNFKKLLSVQIKKFVASGKLVKVKNSYKLPAGTGPAAKKPATEKKTTTEKSGTEKKPKKAVDPNPKAKKVGAPVNKAKAAAKPKATKVKSPRKVAAAKTAVKKAKAAKVKKTPVKAAAATKKPKSIKSPAKKPAAKKAKK